MKEVRDKRIHIVWLHWYKLTRKDKIDIGTKTKENKVMVTLERGGHKILFSIWECFKIWSWWNAVMVLQFFRYTKFTGFSKCDYFDRKVWYKIVWHLKKKRSVILESGRVGFKSQLHHQLVIWLWTTYLTSLPLAFFICEMGVLVPTIQCWNKVNKTYCIFSNK